MGIKPVVVHAWPPNTREEYSYLDKGKKSCLMCSEGYDHGFDSHPGVRFFPTFTILTC